MKVILALTLVAACVTAYPSDISGQGPRAVDWPYVHSKVKQISDNVLHGLFYVSGAAAVDDPQVGRRVMEKANTGLTIVNAILNVTFAAVENESLTTVIATAHVRNVKSAVDNTLVDLSPEIELLKPGTAENIAQLFSDIQDANDNNARQLYSLLNE